MKILVKATLIFWCLGTSVLKRYELKIDFSWLNEKQCNEVNDAGQMWSIVKYCWVFSFFVEEERWQWRYLLGGIGVQGERWQSSNFRAVFQL